MTDPSLLLRLKQARDNTVKHLLDLRSDEGYWKGRLSGSALSTAVTALALLKADPDKSFDHIKLALDWLHKHVNEDGGWGDTVNSPSNLATTLLSYSVLHASNNVKFERVVCRAQGWLRDTCGGLGVDELVNAVLAFYGKDKTFSVPILTHCAIAGVLGDDPWQSVPQLPFEMAALPAGVFRLIRMPVVSYALPALISIGLVRHMRGGGGSVLRPLRNWLIQRVLKKLEQMQPQGGGFLEAAPLTGFVVMSLAEAGYGDSPVVSQGVDFLRHSQRDDGSVPIDTDLSVWLTSHSLRALGDRLPQEERQALREWILATQCREPHPYNGAKPGGWAWTVHPGGVPDADDTSSALIALRHNFYECQPVPADVSESVKNGVEWLLGLQNSDGGFPTFCRGWGTLPFDRSCCDITAHAMQALCLWRDTLPSLRKTIDLSLLDAFRFLWYNQREDGAWLPLWFGNQQVQKQENPVFGTAQVCLALEDVLRLQHDPMLEVLHGKGVRYLLNAQRDGGGWGGECGCRPSVEESALAAAAVAGYEGASSEVCMKAAEWLLTATVDGKDFPAAPIGLYFSSLWYDEKLYPVIFLLKAFDRLIAQLNEGENE